jgi:hypothetical protein
MIICINADDSTHGTEEFPLYIRNLPLVGQAINGIFSGCSALASQEVAHLSPIIVKAAESAAHEGIPGVVGIATLREISSFMQDGERFGEKSLHTTVDLLGEMAGGFACGSAGEIGGRALGTVLGATLGGPAGAVAGSAAGTLIGGLAASIAGSYIAAQGCEHLLDAKQVLASSSTRSEIVTDGGSE